MLLKHFQSLEKTGNGYIVHGDAADVMLVFMTDDIIRVRVSFDRQFKEESYTLVTTAWPDRMDELLKAERTRITALDVPCEEDEKTLTFRTKTLKLVMRKCPLSFLLYNAEGELIYADLRERAFERDHLGRLSHYSRIDYGHDHFYGFGEKTGHLDKKGRRMRMAPKDAIGHDPETGDPMYKHIPFYIRLSDQQRHALGLFYHNSYDSVFDMGQEISGYWDRYSYYQTDGGDIDLFLLNGPSVKAVLDRYTLLTGRPALPTKQSLGYCASTMYYAELEKDCDQEIYKVIEKHRKEGVLIDNFWLASGYTSGEEDNLRYVFNWNRRRFPDPKGFFDKMNEMGINVIPNLKPGILKNHPYMPLFEQNSVFIKNPDGQGDYYGRWWGGEGRFFDFTSPAARATWKQLLEDNLLKLGVKTVWNDNCEMDGVEDREAQCDFEGAKGTMAEMKILHSNLMAYLGKEALAEIYPGERPYIINRAGFAGIQRYAQVWGGDNLTDWRTVKFNIAAAALDPERHLPAPVHPQLGQRRQHRHPALDVRGEQPVHPGGLRPPLPDAALPVLSDVRGPPDRRAGHEAPVPGVPRRPRLLQRPEPDLYVRLQRPGGQRGGKGRRHPHPLPARRLHLVRHERQPAPLRRRPDHRSAGGPGVHPHVPAGVGGVCHQRGRQAHPAGHPAAS